jgi:hypothetical protein
MNQLFDTSPIEDDDGKKKRPSKRKAGEPAAPEPAPIDDALAAILARPAVILGRLDGHVECHRCSAACRDIVEEAGDEWLIECAFCGLKEWSPAIEGHLKPKDGGFVFRDGRFAGKTIEEAAADPRGADYIAWAASEHKRPSVREACQKFLLTASAAVG